jgi:hypothetical protein
MHALGLDHRELIACDSRLLEQHGEPRRPFAGRRMYVTVEGGWAQSAPDSGVERTASSQHIRHVP